MNRLLLAVSVLLLTGCIGSGPGKALHEVALSLERKDSAAFLAMMDTKRYAAAYMDNLTQGNSALKALDTVTNKLLGMGVADMVNSVASVEAQLVADFKKRVSTGELVNECTQTASTACPWVPASLRSARIKELSSDTALAQVTMPGNIATWIALTQIKGEWKIVGLSPQEEFAERFAKNPPSPPQSPSQQPSPPAGSGKVTSI